MRIFPNGNSVARTQNKPERVNPNWKENKCNCPNRTTTYVKTAPLIHGKLTSHDQYYIEFVKHNSTPKTSALSKEKHQGLKVEMVGRTRHSLQQNKTSCK